MSDWRSRSTLVGKDPAMASRQAVLQRNAEGIQNPYQTLPPAPAAPAQQAAPQPVAASDWRSRAVKVQQPVKDPNIVQRIGQRFDQRNQEMQQSADAYVAGDQTMAETVAQQGLSNASKLGDAASEVVTSTPIIGPVVKAIGGAVAEGVSNLPTNYPPAPTVGELLQQTSEQHPRFARNFRAVMQAGTLGVTPKSVDVATQLGTKGVRAVRNIEPVKRYITDERSTSAAMADKVAQRAQQFKSAQEMGKLATESYDEAAYLGSKFSSDQLADKVDAKISALKPKPLPNGKLTAEDNELIRHVEELEGLKGKELSLDEVQRFDEALTQKINKFVDTRTGNLDANGRALYLLQKDLRNLVDEADTAGNNALANGRLFYRAKMMMSDLDAVAARAAMTNNPGKALQSGYRALANDADRIRNWPEDVQAALRKAATPNGLDEALDFLGSRLPALIGLGTGNLAGAATAQVAGMAARGAKEAAIAKRGARVQQAIVDDTMSKVRPVDIPEPQPDPVLQLAAPGKLSPLPMSDEQIAIGQSLMNRPVNTGPDLSGGAIKPPVSQLTNMRERLGRGKSREFENLVKIFEDGDMSQNEFVKDMINQFGLTNTQARSLAQEIKKYGDKK